MPQASVQDPMPGPVSPRAAERDGAAGSASIADRGSIAERDGAEQSMSAADRESVAERESAAESERRRLADRRNRRLWSVLYGSFNPRRRRPARRVDDARFHALDWHAAHLLAVSIGILLLSFADALMTVTLLAGGAVELNPVMAAVISQGAAAFAAVKMTMTGIGVMLMVALARYRFMRVVRVDVVMYALLLSYLVLLSYEFWMLRELIPAFQS
jgi:hypothetical protein